MAEKSLEQKVQCALDFQEVANVMNRYEWYLPGGRYDEVVDLFAKKTPGVRAEIGSWGVYEGTAGIKRLFGRDGLYEWLQGEADDLKPGIMFSQSNTTPVIEVAGDGKMARGVWYCPGHGTGPNDKGEIGANWSWCKQAADFVKEDGEWKLWHYRVYGVFIPPFNSSWVDLEDPGEVERKPFPKELLSDKPTTHPLWMYSKTTSVEYVPAAPKPYETFDDVDSY